MVISGQSAMSGHVRFTPNADIHNRLLQAGFWKRYHAFMPRAAGEQVMIDQEIAFPDSARWRLVHRHRMLFGAWPRLSPPVTFNEHILRRILYDRDPRLKAICNKVALRQFVQDRAGSKYVVPLLGMHEHSKEIAWQALPEKFVLKPSQPPAGL